LKCHRASPTPRVKKQKVAADPICLGSTDDEDDGDVVEVKKSHEKYPSHLDDDFEIVSIMKEKKEKHFYMVDSSSRAAYLST
jgi:hypothetical protein